LELNLDSESAYLREWYAFLRHPLGSSYVIGHSDLLFIARRSRFEFHPIPLSTLFYPRVNTNLLNNQTLHILNGIVRSLFADAESPYYPTCLFALAQQGYKTPECMFASAIIPPTQPTRLDVDHVLGI